MCTQTANGLTADKTSNRRSGVENHYFQLSEAKENEKRLPVREAKAVRRCFHKDLRLQEPGQQEPALAPVKGAGYGE